MTSTSTDALLERIKTAAPEALKKDKSAIISAIVHGRHTEAEQMLLRRELQQRLLEKPEVKDKTLAELQGTEEEISRRSETAGKLIKKLADSDGKVSKMKKGQEKISEEILKVQTMLQKRKKTTFKEDMVFVGALGLFFSVCAYVVIDRLVVR